MDGLTGATQPNINGKITPACNASTSSGVITVIGSSNCDLSFAAASAPAWIAYLMSVCMNAPLDAIMADDEVAQKVYCLSCYKIPACNIPFMC